jgi:hypothetical protein
MYLAFSTHLVVPGLCPELELLELLELLYRYSAPVTCSGSTDIPCAAAEPNKNAAVWYPLWAKRCAARARALWHKGATEITFLFSATDRPGQPGLFDFLRGLCSSTGLVGREVFH